MRPNALISPAQAVPRIRKARRAFNSSIATLRETSQSLVSHRPVDILAMRGQRVDYLYIIIPALQGRYRVSHAQHEGIIACRNNGKNCL